MSDNKIVGKGTPRITATLELSGLFGAKGVGEGGLDPTAAALANAVYDVLNMGVK